MDLRVAGFNGRVPTEMRMEDIRQVAEAVAPKATGRYDIERIPFGIEVELEGFDPKQLTSTIQNLPPWNFRGSKAPWKLEGDQGCNPKKMQPFATQPDRYPEPSNNAGVGRCT